MKTVSEFLKEEGNQLLTLDKIVGCLRKSGEWGSHGLYTKLGKKTGFSAAYVGQVLTGRKPLTDKFVQEIAEYLGVDLIWLLFDGRIGLSEKDPKDTYSEIMSTYKDILEMYRVIPLSLIPTLNYLALTAIKECDKIQLYHLNRTDKHIAEEMVFTRTKLLDTIQHHSNDTMT